MQQRFVNDEESRTGARTLSGGDAATVSVSATPSQSAALSEETLHAQAVEKVESRRRAHVRALLVQPALYWSVLMLVAATTGILSSANPSLRQPILLHAVPQALALLAGYRLKDPKLGAISGASFHVARGILIVMLAAWPTFSAVLRDYPGQMAWLFLLPPALGALGGYVGQQRAKASKAGRRLSPMAPLGPIAAGLGIIAATTGGIAPRFLPGPTDQGMVPIAVAGLPTTLPADGPPMFWQSDGRLTVGNSEYAYRQQTRTLTGNEDLSLPGLSGAVPQIGQGEVLGSADGNASLRLDPSGNLVWDQAGAASRIIAQGSDGAFANLSISADGNMAIFQQGESYQVFTPSKGTRPVEDLVRQFWKNPPFTVPDGASTFSGFDPAGGTLRTVFADPDGQRYAFELLMGKP